VLVWLPAPAFVLDEDQEHELDLDGLIVLLNDAYSGSWNAI